MGKGGVNSSEDFTKEREAYHTGLKGGRLREFQCIFHTGKVN